MKQVPENTAEQVKHELSRFAKPEDAEGKKRFFKTAPGSYGEGDIFIAVSNADLRKTARRHIDLSFSELEKLLSSEIHEHRQTALFILMLQFERGGREQQKPVYDFYLAHLDAVNNWDLVDLSAHYIIGTFLLDKKDRSVIYRLAGTDDLWRERIAMVSTFAFIRNMDFADTLRLAENFIPHRHDLIHKAAGWMLREIGKRDFETENHFLKKHYRGMPRTMLRYAIEKFPDELRRKYLNGEIQG
ncbi:MAG: DNA alkylation repair protein [Victivallaceae bacterium]|nr:DNA alkylation repair protein [Victivallaceae bacterium]